MSWIALIFSPFTYVAEAALAAELAAIKPKRPVKRVYEINANERMDKLALKERNARK